MKLLNRVLAACALTLGMAAMATAGPINLATSGTASQSSTGYWGWAPTADLAIDGNTDGNYWHGSVAHTRADYEAWWMVDLGDVYSISSIEVWNRTDCCVNRITPYSVSILDASSVVAWTQTFYTTPTPAELINLNTAVNGQYVRVQLEGHRDYLQLAEVKVMGVAVSEPGTFALLGLGLLGLGIARKRQA